MLAEIEDEEEDVVEAVGLDETDSGFEGWESSRAPDSGAFGSICSDFFVGASFCGATAAAGAAIWGVDLTRSGFGLEATGAA
jgi:hypothetical protein